MEMPKQEHKTGLSQRASVSLRDLVTINKDNAPGGAANPSYGLELGTNIHAEILQVGGGEIVRGIAVEANTKFVVTINYHPSLGVDDKCEVVIGSGVYSGQKLYSNCIHFETPRGMRRKTQIHCKAN